MVFGILFYGTVGWVTVNHQRVTDQIRVWNFTPPAAITAQIHRTGMNAEGKFLYLASHPKVETAYDFNTACGDVTNDPSIVSCYLDTPRQVVLFEVTDRRVDGTEDVAAAHGMLRAAWDRMTASQRKSLVHDLNAVVRSDPADERLPERMTSIEKNDPADRDAELFAIVGTEVPRLDATLEASYAKYFGDRSVVTALNAHALEYSIALGKQIKALDATMTALGHKIDKSTKRFNGDVPKLNAAIHSFNARAVTPGGFATQAQFNSERAALVARQKTLKKTAKKIDAEVKTFNSDLKKLTKLSKTAGDLFVALSPDLAPLPSTLDA